MPTSIFSTERSRFPGMFLMSPTRHLLGYRIGEINTVHIAATRCTWYDLVRSQEVMGPYSSTKTARPITGTPTRSTAPMAVDTSSPPQGPAGQDLSTVSLDPQRPGPSQDAPTRTAYTAEQYHHFCEELTRQVAARDQEIQRLKAELASRQSPVDWTAQVKTPESFEKSDRLTGTQNWYTWSRRINNALDQAGLSAFLTGEAVCPLKPPGSHSCTCVGVANPFHRVDRAVAAFVCNQIADQCTVEAKAFPSTRHLLAHLDREYGSGRPEVKRSLVLEQRTRLDRLDHPTTPEKLKTFIVQVDDIQARLTDLGEPLSPEDVALKIIAKFDDPSQRAQALMSQKLSWDDLKTKMRINGILASSSSARAQNPVKRPRDAQQGARSSCSFCGIPGHGDADCRHRKKASEHFKAQRSKKAEAKPKPTSNGQTVKAINITDVFGDIPNTADMIEAYPYDSTTTSNSPPEPRCDIPVASGPQAVDTCSRNITSDRLCAMTTSHNPPPSNYDILVDSGATKHVAGNRSWFKEYEPSNGAAVSAANNENMSVSGKGTIPLVLEHSSKAPPTFMLLNNAWHVPALGSQVYFSVSAAADKGIQTLFDDTNVYLFRKSDGRILAVGDRIGDLYYLHHTMMRPEAVSHLRSLSTSNTATEATWHARMGHTNPMNLRALYRGMADGMKVEGRKQYFCESCIQGKGTRFPFQRKKRQDDNRKATEVLGRVCTDLKGPLIEALGGERYVMVLLDQHTHYITVYCFKHKNQAFDFYKQYRAHAKNMHDKEIKILRTDGGGEYVSTDFEQFLNDHGTVHEMTTPGSSQENSQAERAIRTLLNTARSLLHYAGAPVVFWREAMYFAAYIMNRLPTKALRGKTPYELWFKRKPDLSRMRTFGCAAYPIIPDAKRNNDLSGRSKKCIFLGYDERSSGYVLYDPSEHKFFPPNRDVYFNEEDFPFRQMDRSDPLFDWESEDPDDDTYVPDQSEGTDIPESCETEDEVCVSTRATSRRTRVPHQPASTSVLAQSRRTIPSLAQPSQQTSSSAQDGGSPGAAEVVSSERQHDSVRRSARKRPQREFDWFVNSGCINAVSCKRQKIHEPRSVKEALRGPYAAQWLQAMKSELTSHADNGTWSLVDTGNPSGSNRGQLGNAASRMVVGQPVIQL